MSMRKRRIFMLAVKRVNDCRRVVSYMTFSCTFVINKYINVSQV